MPAANGYPEKYEDVDKMAENERKERSAHYAAAWKYYRGDHKKPLKVTPGQPDDNVILNLCKILVDRGVSMLFGKGIDFQLTGEGDSEAAQEYLDSVWNGGQDTESNLMLLQLNDIALNGYVTGQPITKIMPPKDEDGLPRIINLDPSVVTPFWAKDDIDEILWYSLYWDEDRRQDIINTDTGWLVRELERGKSRTWQLIDEMMWPFDWSPLVTWKNLPNPNEFYGVSEIDHADLNDKINFLASNIQRILQNHAHPKTIVLGAHTDDIVPHQVGGIFSINRDNVQVFNLEMQSDLMSSMGYLNELCGLFFSLGASVDITTLKDKIGQITNFALNVMFKDAVDRLWLKQALYGEALSEINARLLDIGGFPGLKTSVVWRPAVPSDPLEEIEIVERQTDLGVISKETAARQLGIDWEAEQELLADQSTGQDVGTAILENLAFNRGQ